MDDASGDTIPVSTPSPIRRAVRMTGVFLAAGPGIQPGALKDSVLLEDFAPTIAGLLGEKLTETDGVPIAAVCGAPAE